MLPIAINVQRFGKTCFYYILIPFIVSVAILLFYDSSTYSGELRILNSGNLKLDSITIKRDEFGVPSIEGKTLVDVSYGQGYVHAQDRLWAVHFRKLLFAGRLSEYFGESMVKLDKYMRSVGHERYAKYSMSSLDETMAEMLEAYVKGFNDAVGAMNVLPLEFWLTWLKFEPLTSTDVMSSARGIAFYLAWGYQNEPLFAKIETLLGTQLAKELLPLHQEYALYNVTIMNDDDLKKTGIYDPFDENVEFVAPSNQVWPEERRPPTKPTVGNFNESSSNYQQDRDQSYMHEKIPEETVKLHQDMTEVLGSNAWIVHGNHTTTGKPILANDPHLSNGMPSFWYNSALFFGHEYLTGLSVAGVPGIVVGRNRHISWGVTSTYIDVGDLYNLTTSGNMYFYEGHWHPMKEFHEEIKIHGQTEALMVTIYETHHGVVLDPYFVDFFGKKGYDAFLEDKFALAWPGYIHNDSFLNSFYKLWHAKEAKDVYEAWRDTATFNQNLHFATSSGDIGYLLLGRIPIRKTSVKGGKPLDGSLAVNDWVGWIPWEDQPRIINPTKGYIASGNNKIAGNNLKWHPNTFQPFTSRGVRIYEMLSQMIASGKKISVNDIKTMQLDVLDVLARQTTPIIIKCAREAFRLNYSPKIINIQKLESLLQELEKWDFRMEKTSVGATIHAVWEVMLKNKVLHSVNISDTARRTMSEESLFEGFLFKKVLEFESLKSELFDQFWCQNDENREDPRPCLYNLVRSLEEAYEYLEKALGDDISEWEWSRIHNENYPHLPLGQSKILRKVFNRAVPTSGNGRTIKVSNMVQSKSGYDGTASPNMRMIADMSQSGRSYAVIDTGISGRVQSKHYDDQMKVYQDGEWLELVQMKPESYKDKLDISFYKH